jgi:ATP-dependent DNA helicase RecG
LTQKELILKLSDIEWEDFEAKEAQSEIPKNSWETVSAFSNTSGGWLIFGIKKIGKKYEIVGVKNPEKIEQDFTNTLRGEKFNVKIVPLCKYYKFKEGNVLAFYIPLSDKKPIYFNTQANTFIRTASGDQRATKEEIDAMFRDQAFGTYTSKSIAKTSVKNISKQSYDRYKDYLSNFNPSHPYNRLSKDEFLQKLRILSNGKLTYGGLLCLGTEDVIQKQIPGFRVDYLEIPGTNYADAKTRYTYRIDELENLWEYYFAIFDRLRRQLDLPFKLTQEGFAIEDHPQLDALREALVNMLMHTDYFSGGCARIRVFDDRIEFFNPGALPKPLETLMEEDISLPRNPIIAKFFRVVKLAENAGYGFDKMINGWKAYTGSIPEFDQGLDYTKVIFFLKKRINQTETSLNSDIIAFRNKYGRITEELRKNYGRNAEEILVLIDLQPEINTTEIAKLIEKSQSTVEKIIKKLREAKLIERIGSTKAGSWKINL